ncbi:MAG: hypothetical protein RLN69_13720, partial [Woeseiaceae bacterium]
MYKFFIQAQRLLLATMLTLSATTFVQAQESAEYVNATKAASIPDKVETSIGTLEFFDGVPIGKTSDKIYDYLDRSRGLNVYLDNIGAVSIYSVLAGIAEQGADAPNKIAIWEQLM